MTEFVSDKSVLLSDLPPYIYGTTRLGHAEIPFNERIEIAQTALDKVTWFHTSHHYDDALDVLQIAFAQARHKIPKLIVKIGWNSVEEVRETIYRNLDPLGLESLDIGQLCLVGDLAGDFASGGPCIREFEQMKKNGLVKRFVMEVFPWTSETPLKALRSGHAEGLIDGYIFYLNPLQRFASNELWDLLVERNEPMIAMRTVAGGPVFRLRDEPGFAWREYLQQRAAEVAPIFERSGIANWTDFCVRFAHSFPQVRATVGSTARRANLQEFLTAIKNIKPLPQDIIDEIVKLHYRWSDELDMQAEPWSL